MDISVWASSRKADSFSLTLTTGKSLDLFILRDILLKEGSQEWKNIVQADEQLAKKFDPSSVSRHLPTACFNCHGLSLANRRGWFNDAYIAIFSENYVEIMAEQIVLEGDLVSYFEFKMSGKMELSHTGIVANVDSNSKLQEILKKTKKCRVISKWGFYGEYIHDLFCCPYTENNYEVKIYRFQRGSFD